jgi:hypothetical protein
MTSEQISLLTDEVTRLEVARQRATDQRDTARMYFNISIGLMVVGALMLIINLLLALIVLMAGFAGLLIMRSRQQDADAEITRLNGQILDRRDKLANALAQVKEENVEEAKAEKK